MVRRSLIALLITALPAFAAPPTHSPARDATGGSNDGGGSSQIPIQSNEAPKEVLKYLKSTPEQDAQAITDAQKRAAETAEQLGVKFTELQTPHFIIFTDWDTREYNFLKQNVEGAYSAVSRQFEMSPKDNIFVGKLPIYMFVKREKFLQFAKEIDKFDPPKGLAGYCQYRSDGFCHMSMSKPDLDAAGGNIAFAEKSWAYVLTHEFTHAFVARYRTNRIIPRWLNEGLAEVVANTQFPQPSAITFAHMMANGKNSVSEIFDDSKMPPFQMYPVMMTLTKALIQNDPQKFLKFFNAIKDGAEPEACLKENYNVDYDGLETAWRKYMKTVR